MGLLKKMSIKSIVPMIHCHGVYYKKWLIRIHNAIPQKKTNTKPPIRIAWVPWILEGDGYSFRITIINPLLPQRNKIRQIKNTSQSFPEYGLLNIKTHMAPMRRPKEAGNPTKTPVLRLLNQSCVLLVCPVATLLFLFSSGILLHDLLQKDRPILFT